VTCGGLGVGRDSSSEPDRGTPAVVVCDVTDRREDSDQAGGDHTLRRLADQVASESGEFPGQVADGLCGEWLAELEWKFDAVLLGGRGVSRRNHSDGRGRTRTHPKDFDSLGEETFLRTILCTLVCIDRSHNERSIQVLN
jgi:hypothetical protein